MYFLFLLLFLFHIKFRQLGHCLKHQIVVTSTYNRTKQKKFKYNNLQQSQQQKMRIRQNKTIKFVNYSKQI